MIIFSRFFAFIRRLKSAPQLTIDNLQFTIIKMLSKACYNVARRAKFGSYVFLLIFSSSIFAANFSSKATYEVCFTPDENCTSLVVNAINHAQHQILIQAYTFTSKPIYKALFFAKRRDIDVSALFDKSALPTINDNFSIADYFAGHGINTKIDYEPNIAHNKVMIIDNQTVITGSFNFTHAAQNDNTENLLIINDPTLAAKYLANWQQREKKSISISEAKQKLGAENVNNS
jgi:phosphatidylserine/phosphatidylglycerophosphate/cardiolipin synthase-like enzyme